jgi:hypothetical protein
MAGLHACTEHLDGTDDDGGQDSGAGTSKEWSVVVRYAILHGTVWICSQPIVASKVNDVGRDRHEQGRAQAAPQGCKAFIAGNLLQTIEGRVESSSLRLLCRTLRNKHLVDSKSSGRGHAVGALVGNVIDFSTGCRDWEGALRRRAG